jgi:hypothetical protein
MIIRTTVLLMLLICSGTAQAQDIREHQDSIEEDTAHIERKTTEEPEQTRWPLPFNPSQEIGADSQVSFPTDI